MGEQPTINQRELWLLAEKCASLSFELLGFYEVADGQIQHRSAGSGMFVAPCQGITARHVVNDLHRVSPEWTDEVRRKERSGYFYLPYHGLAFQIFDINEPNRAAEWGVTRVWMDTVTDAASLELAPGNPEARIMMDRMRPLFPTWSLLPPPVGATVVLVGQHRDQSAPGEAVPERATYRIMPALVTENFEREHDRGMYNFPGYFVNVDVPHGMSGGAVFWEGRFCGLISGGLGGSTYIASLWPMCLTKFESPNLGILNREITLEKMFDTGQLKAVDWNRVKGLISYATERDRCIPLLRSPDGFPLDCE